MFDKMFERMFDKMFWKSGGDLEQQPHPARLPPFARASVSRLCPNHGNKPSAITITIKTQPVQANASQRQSWCEWCPCRQTAGPTIWPLISLQSDCSCFDLQQSRSRGIRQWFWSLEWILVPLSCQSCSYTSRPQSVVDLKKSFQKAGSAGRAL